MKLIASISIALLLTALTGCGVSDEQRCSDLQNREATLEAIIDATANRSDLTPEEESARAEAIPQFTPLYQEMDAMNCPHNQTSLNAPKMKRFGILTIYSVRFEAV